ncbi:exodeoxyribonuclease V (plasmid) [Azospirillum sp. TSH58]|uniref:ATP-dependent DNA helicase n=1 Tax=Azospirillum sp. TSH58 TaxID=664962 RepID=UPI000D5FED6F|nr:AAA family ATPase [Azospirillum sp. TSH58]AWJ82294.1 exodeoxyribonuclease V [Azospirillum sp. TSH58]PWC72976.1 exodeoxyribonuclease V [Azospirillum sp. TSH58]
MPSTSDTPTDEQFRAIQAIDAWYADPAAPQMFWLAGEAGTGKTKTTVFALDHLQDRRNLENFVVGAPTGKAAQVLRRKGIDRAATLHSLIYAPRQDDDTGELFFARKSEGKFAEADLIVCDEGSMVGDDVAGDLLRSGKKILMIADDYQLPPVTGQGTLTQGEPDFRLVEPHRTARESPVIRLAHLLRRQELPRRFGTAGNAHVLPLNRVTEPLALRVDTQTICGTHRVRTDFTRRIRTRHGFDTVMPQAGERVICRRNDREEGLFNGMIGTLTRPAAEGRGRQDGLWSLGVHMEDEVRPRGKLMVHPWMFQAHYSGETKAPRVERDVQQFDWAWMITCHSAQGSEFPSVTVLDDSAAFREHKWRWLYTAVTRSQDELFLLLRNADLGGNWRMPDLDA